MGETDNPLKLLIAEHQEAFATWLLNRPVRRVRPLNVEFPAQGSQGDMLFEVIDGEGNLIILHIELQGRRSPEPMPLRMLDYLARIVRREIDPAQPNPPRLHSIVLYVGDGAGREDNGRYDIPGLDDTIILRWQYQPIRLWEMDAEALLNLGNPALLALIGQTRLSQPDAQLPQALSAIRQIDDSEQKDRLLTALVSLLRNEEVIKMVEKILEQSEELLLDTPYLRRMRRIGWEEGRQEGRQEGWQEGRQEGRQEGWQEGWQKGQQDGQVNALRTILLDAVVRRFNPSAADYRLFEQRIAAIHDVTILRSIYAVLFDAADFAAFQASVEQEL
jgi:predicted transposase YdaD